MEGIGEPDQHVDDGQEEPLAGREPPGQQDQGEKGNTIRGEGDGDVAEPSVAEGYVAVFVVHVEAVDFPEEKDGEDQMGEFVREFHQPSHVVPHAGEQEKDEERAEANEKGIVEPDPAERCGLHPDGSDQHADGQQDKGGEKDAVQHVDRLTRVPACFSFP